MTRRHNPRRGILLLIVLSLLVLFVVIGVTFIVVAGQYTKSAKAFSRHEQQGMPPRQLLDDAVMKLLRGTRDSGNPLRTHSLLGDLYGNDGFEGEVLLAGTQPQRDQLLQIGFQDASLTARPSADYYSGSVLTLVDGSGAGHSTRILRYTPPQVITGGVEPGTLLVEAFKDVVPNRAMSGSPTSRFFVPLPGTRFVVNGRQFNGLGRGLSLRANSMGGTAVTDPVTGDIDWAQPLLREAVVPGIIPVQEQHLPFWQPITPFTGSSNQFDYPYRGFANRHGDVDESHDAADYMNVFLARIPTGSKPAGAFDVADPLIPSFHRPYLELLDPANWRSVG